MSKHRRMASDQRSPLDGVALSVTSVPTPRTSEPTGDPAPQPGPTAPLPTRRSLRRGIADGDVGEPVFEPVPDRAGLGAGDRLSISRLLAVTAAVPLLAVVGFFGVNALVGDTDADPEKPAADTAPEIPARQLGGNAIIPVLSVFGGKDVPGARTLSVAVSLQDGDLGIPAVDRNLLGRTIMSTLSDDRGWTAASDVGFAPLPETAIRQGREADIHFALVTPDLANRLCNQFDAGAPPVCFTGSAVLINATEWARGAGPFGDNQAAYRSYLVNHGVGLAFGSPLASCSTPGAPAPIMMQQTKDLMGCVANAWPQPVPSDA